ncbi:RNA polymerase I-specific transcription initiation factor-domain-containing protein [Biscogniauxia marginata]|nr:RNA polymerase I-specific transcription initiation factor-domain-containing protein [Biscogniauxia marginata]
MAYTADNSDEYLPSSEESEPEERPNRWIGPSSTWQQLNSAEIDTVTALNEIRNQDLSIHLYNAFALKQRRKKPQDTRAPISGKDINAATGKTVEQDDWVPHRSWTAWPMRADKVPHQEFMRRTDDSDEQFTSRRAVQEMPSTALEETISAAVLRAAKDKIKARPSAELATAGLEDSDEGSDVDTLSTTRRTRSESRPIKYDSAAEADKMEIDEIRDKTVPYVPLRKRYFKPIIATDDDLSHTILRPSIRHVLSKLDTTLTILHNVQDSTLNYQSDSADSDASDSSRRGQRPTRDRSRAGARKRGRPPKSHELSQIRSSVPPETPADGKKRMGRPRKVYPRLDDETDQEYTIRIARMRKERVPVFADPETEPEAETGAESAPDQGGGSSGGSERESSAGESAAKKPKLKRKRARGKSPEIPGVAPNIKGKGKLRIGLRDWKDVLGAAALAGFPAPALDRAARRCADLFGQSMVLQTLTEAPPGRTAPRKFTRYEPGMPLPPLLLNDADDEDGEEEDRGIALHIARRSRAASTAPDAKLEDNNRGLLSLPRGRSTSRSGSGIAGASHFCTFGDCPRAVDGFARRYNLTRHMKLVHGVVVAAAATTTGGEDLATAAAAGDVDSEDEMHGAVHVDGFLRPIKVRPGWRAGDVAEEARRRGRSRSRSRRAPEGGGNVRVKREARDEGDYM